MIQTKYGNISPYHLPFSGQFEDNHYQDKIDDRKGREYQQREHALSRERDSRLLNPNFKPEDLWDMRDWTKTRHVPKPWWINQDGLHRMASHKTIQVALDQYAKRHGYQRWPEFARHNDIAFHAADINAPLDQRTNHSLETIFKSERLRRNGGGKAVKSITARIIHVEAKLFRLAGKTTESAENLWHNFFENLHRQEARIVPETKAAQKLRAEFEALLIDDIESRIEHDLQFVAGTYSILGGVMEERDIVGEETGFLDFWRGKMFEDLTEQIMREYQGLLVPTLQCKVPSGYLQVLSSKAQEFYEEKQRTGQLPGPPNPGSRKEKIMPKPSNNSSDSAYKEKPSLLFRRTNIASEPLLPKGSKEPPQRTENTVNAFNTREPPVEKGDKIGRKF